MANKYWVGGTASWDATAGSKWAATSGGVGGEPAPTPADDVFFDANSSGTVTIAAGNNGAKSINCTGFSGTIAGTGAITIVGSVTLSATMAYTHTGTVTFTGTGTLTTSGKNFSAIVINGAGITVTLGDAISTATRTITLTAGTFDTAGFTLTTGSFLASNSNVRSLVLGASTWTISGGFDASNAANFTVSAGTSQINLTLSNSQFNAGAAALTFNNVTFTSVSPGTRSMLGSPTFNNLTLNGTATGLSQLSIASSITVTGTLTCSGTSAIQRCFLRSLNIGGTVTITAGTLAAADCDFRDITIAGGAAGSSPTRAGNCGGNSGITFPAAKTVYRVGTNTTWAGSASWATGSNGTGDNVNFPLAQDTAVIDNGTALTGTLTLSLAYNISALDCSARTTALTLSHDVLVDRYGSYILGSGITVTGGSTQIFSGRGAMVIDTSGKSLTFSITITAVNGSLSLQSNVALGSLSALTLTSGSLLLNSFTFSCAQFASNNANVRAIDFGTGEIRLTLTGGLLWETSNATNLTVSGTSTVTVQSASTAAVTISPGTPTEANAISFRVIAGNQTLTISGNILNLDLTGSSGTITNSTRIIYGDLSLGGRSLGTGVGVTTFGSTSATPRTITAGGGTIFCPIAFNGVGGKWVLQGALGVQTNGITHTNGTLDLNGFTLTNTATYTTGVGTKNLTFNGGILLLSASGTPFNNAQPTGFTTTKGTGDGKIRFTSASTKTFAGGGSTFNCIVSNDGVGALTITGNNTIDTLANGVQPTTFSFTAGTTTTINNWNVSGTAGNLVTIGSATAASHTLSKSSGTVSANFLSISRSSATGGAAWYAGANSTNGGNNTGWIFANAPSGDVNTSNFLMLFI